MDNNLNDVLDVKQSEAHDTAEVKVTSNNAEKTLKIFANVILICGILGSVILLFVGIAQIADLEEEVGWMLILYAIPVLLVSVIQWAFISVVCNISNNLREINSKTK